MRRPGRECSRKTSSEQKVAETGTSSGHRRKAIGAEIKEAWYRQPKPGRGGPAGPIVRNAGLISGMMGHPDGLRAEH